MSLDIATLSIEVDSKSVPKAVAELSKLEKQATTTQGATNQFGQSTQSLQSQLFSLKNILVGVSSTMAGIYAKNAVLAAARYETLGVVLNQSGKNANYASYEMAAFEKQLQKAGIAMTESRQTLTSLATSQIDLAEASKLARAAQDVAVVGGLNSSEAFSRLVYGIRSSQVEILRTIGISVSWEQAYKNVAAEMGKTASSLTEQEKLQARVNIALEEAAKYQGIYEASMTTAGKQLGSLSRYFDNIRVLVGEVGLDAFSIALQDITKNAKAVEGTLQGLSDTGKLADIGKDIGEAFRFAVDNIDDVAIVLGTYTIAQKLATSETLKNIAAEGQRVGILGAIKAQIVSLNAAESQKIAIQNQEIVAQRALLTQEVERLKTTMLVEAAEVRHRKALADSLAGTTASARASAVLNAARIRQTATSNALIIAEMKLATAMKATAVTMSTTTAIMTGLRGVTSGFIAMMGGGWMIALMAAVAVGYQFYENQKEISEALADGTKRVDDWRNSIDKAKKSLAELNQEAWQLEVDTIEKKMSTLQASMQEMNFSPTFSLERLTDFSGVEGQVEQIVNKTKAAIEAAGTYEERITAARTGEQQLLLLQGNGGDSFIAEALPFLEQYRTSTEQLLKLEKDRAALGESADQARKLREEAQELDTFVQKYEAFINMQKEIDNQGLLTSFSDATSYLSDMITKSNMMAEKQKEIAASSFDTAISLVQQEISTARRLGKLEEVARLEAFIAQANAARKSGPATKTGSTGSGSSQTESAKKSLEALNKEMMIMRGESTVLYDFNMKLLEIEKTAKQAGVSSTQFLQAYKQAFAEQQENARFTELQNIEKEIASLLGNDKTVKAIELAQGLDSMSKSLIELNVPIEQQTELMNRWVEAKNAANDYQDIQAAASFMSELVSMTGAYGLDVEYQNKVLKAQADIYRSTLPQSMQGYIDQWLRIKELENSADPFDGLERGFRKWTSDAGDLAGGLEDLVVSSFDGMAGALADFVVTGKADFASLATSIASDLARIATQAMISKVLTSVFGFATGGVAKPIGLPGTSGVLTKPTYFYNTGSNQKTFATGGPAVAGEAGPEVFMPAKRLPSGDFGVRVQMGEQAGGSGSVIVNQTNNFTLTGSGQTDGSTSLSEKDMQSFSKMIEQYTVSAVQKTMKQESKVGGFLSGM